MVVERFGPLRFRLKPTLSPAGITMPVRGWSIWHVPLPGWLAPSSDARETMDDQGRFRFDVQLSLPLVGTVAHYCGWLVPAVAAAATPRTGSEKVAGPNA